MTDEDNSSSQPPRPPGANRDETWKEQIRRAILESQRNIQQQQAAQQAPGYRITLNVPRETKSYYDQVRADNPYGIKRDKSDSELHRRGKKRPGTGGYESQSRRGPNVTSTAGAASRYTNWTKHSAKSGTKLKSKRKRGLRPGETSSGEWVTTERGATTEGHDTDGAGSSRRDDDQVLSYFDPNFVKEEFKEIMEKSRNIVVGPPREILQKYFGYTDEDQIPEELREDDTPKAFILPRKFWKDYDDAPLPTQRSSTGLQGPDSLIAKKQDLGFVPDRRLLARLGEEPEVEPYVARQPKNFAVDYLARQPFKKYGLISSNLNDASPGMMEHLELKDVNVDPGGHLRRDEESEKKFKISEITGTPVKVAAKEGALKDEKRPWYSDGWAEGADPNVLKKSPAFTEGGDDIGPPDDGGRRKPGRKGKGRRRSNEDDRGDSSGRHRRRKPRRSGSSLSSGSQMDSNSSSSSSGSGYSCTCGYSSSSGSGSSSSSGSGESGEGGEGEDESRKRSKSRRRKGKHKHYSGEEDGEGGRPDEEPSRKDIAIAANINMGEELPPWAPASWKPPPGYKGWIYKPKAVTHSAPDTSVKLGEDPHNSRLPGSDWFRAFGVVKKAEKEGTIENLRNILGYIEGEDDLKKLEMPDDEGMSDHEGGEEWDVMERLPRGDLPSRRMYPEHPTPDHFKYYRSYPLYPSLSTERYFEWYKDVGRLMNPFGRRSMHRPAGYSRSMGHINWNDPKEAAKWYALGYRRPDSKPKPERPDYNTKDYIYNNARSIMLMPPKKVIPKYIDDRHGTSHFLEPSGLVRKYIFREDFGTIPEYLMGRNEEQCRPRCPDMDKFYRPHRCKYLHGHIHCKICMRAHPTVKTYNREWECDMTPQDYERASMDSCSNSNSSGFQFLYSGSKSGKKGVKSSNNFDVECLLNDLGLGEEYRRSKAARGGGGSQNFRNVNGSSLHVNLSHSHTSPVYV